MREHLLKSLRGWLLVFCCGTLIAANEANAVLFRIGIARRDITPKQPLPLWGYGSRHDTPSTGVLDSLYATALVIQCESNKLAIVSLDLGRTPGQASLHKIRNQIEEKCGIQHAFISATHTHSGPVVELTEKSSRGKFDASLRYYGVLEQEVVSAITAANENLTDARIGVSSIQLRGMQVNRQSTDQPELGDHALTIARFDTMDGKVRAIVANFSAHPNLIDPATLQFSADYVASLRSAVESNLPGKLVFLQGAAGDQSASPSAVSDPQPFGARLAWQVISAVTNIVTKTPVHGRLQVTEDRFRFDSRLDLSDPRVRGRLDAFFFPELVAAYAEDYADGIEPRLVVATIDDVCAFVGVSGEFFAQHSLRLKERFPSTPIFFVGYCNGYHQYFPTIEAVARGGYGTQPFESPVCLGAGEVIMNTAVARLLQMNGNISATDKVFTEWPPPSKARIRASESPTAAGTREPGPNVPAQGTKVPANN